jgi:hypothetical protein
VEPNKNNSQKNLDRLEGKLQKKFMTMEYHGGINLRDETKRHGVQYYGEVIFKSRAYRLGTSKIDSSVCLMSVCL